MIITFFLGAEWGCLSITLKLEWCCTLYFSVLILNVRSRDVHVNVCSWTLLEHSQLWILQNSDLKRSSLKWNCLNLWLCYGSPLWFAMVTCKYPWKMSLPWPVVPSHSRTATWSWCCSRLINPLTDSAQRLTDKCCWLIFDALLISKSWIEAEDVFKLMCYLTLNVKGIGIM